MKYLKIILNNGKEFDVVGETVDDVPSSVINGTGWSCFQMTHGLYIQIKSDQIAAVVESQYWTHQ